MYVKKLLLISILILGYSTIANSQTKDFKEIGKLEIKKPFEIINDLITGLSVDRMGQLYHFKKDVK